MDEWTKLSQLVLNVVQALAVVLAGAWAYFKFIRGRTFARRAELDVDATVETAADRHVIRLKVTFRNTGLSKIPFKAKRKIASLSATSTSHFAPGANLTWQDVMITPIFEADEFVEAQETIQDEVLLPLDEKGGPWLAFRLEVEVWAEPRWKRNAGTRWIATAVLPVQSSAQTGGGRHGS
ncbi:MAG TPA: hypothetical protein VN906_11470 [Candidatus Sulfotelmatobacter sp.]|nr:hypothetical protein [Candidatus Sulfotelmatobacter sp.]